LVRSTHPPSGPFLQATGRRRKGAPTRRPEAAPGLLRDLREVLGPSHVWTDPVATRLFSRDASMLQGSCTVVALPSTRQQAIDCVRIARRYEAAIVPRGAGTGLAGGATPTGDQLVIATTRMNRILEVRPADRLARVEPGVLNLDLKRAVASAGLTFAPDPASEAASTIGGNVATNAGGPHCLLYGVTSNHVLGVEAVLADGSVVRMGSEGTDAPGYDLRGLMVGSEGTLGLITEITVLLTPLPEATQLILLSFSSVEAAGTAVLGIIAAGVVPAALELMDRPIIQAVEAFCHAGYPVEAEAILLVELQGSAAAVAQEAGIVELVAREHAVQAVQVATGPDHRARLWKGRKSALGSVAAIAPHYYQHDCVVPRTRLAEALRRIRTIVDEHDLMVVNMFHAGDGNLHPVLLFDRRIPGTLDRVLAASELIVRTCLDMGGSLSGEHGIGLEKRDFMPLMYTAPDLEAQRHVKDAFDPDHRMNWGKVLPLAPIDATVGDPGRRRVVPADAHPVTLGGRERIEPASREALATLLAGATATGRRLLPVGGGVHLERGNPVEVDAEVSTRAFNRWLEYEPAEMVARVESGVTYGALDAALAEHGQEWPVDAPPDATIGGIVAAGVSSARRLNLGLVRDWILGLEIVTGDGRIIRAGGRTVKNVSGYDLPRLFIGSLGTLGIIVAVDLKLRPRPALRRTLRAPGDLRLAETVLARLPHVAGLVASRGMLELRLEGWPEDVEEQQRRAAEIVGAVVAEDGGPFPAYRPWFDRPVVLEVGVAPSRLAELASSLDVPWGALVGTGQLWAGFDRDDRGIQMLRERVAQAAGSLAFLRGRGAANLERSADRPSPEVARRLKAAFDPAGILAPGRLCPEP
jgi:glycolate oxidase subunit GlcD